MYARSLLLPFTVQQDGMKARFPRSLYIFSQTIPNVHRLFRIDGMLLQRRLKNFRRWLRGLCETRDRHCVEYIGDPESTHHGKQTGIKIRDNTEL
jgi:hypothetical protein